MNNVNFRVGGISPPNTYCRYVLTPKKLRVDSRRGEKREKFSAYAFPKTLTP
jgi:hypothetical protein